MCGIAGAFDLTGQRLFPPQRLQAMLAALVHRGPDDRHVHFEPGLAVGSNRLAIVDPPSGRQPIGNERGDVWVAFNGELFDYPELRADLAARGHRLATHCDTELWVHLYEEHGEDVFRRAVGQFAVALWDRERRVLFLARDRIGICPLHYAEHDGWLLWGSEIKALLASGLIAPKPDVRAINHFFTLIHPPTARTCFENVTSLAPGNYVKIRDGRIERRQYWDLEFPDAGQEQHYGDPRAATDELEQRLRLAVRRRLRGDVPVAAYLSGGLDSAVVTALVRQELGRPPAVFTVGLDRAGPDERSEAAESAAACGAALTTVAISRGEISATYPELIRAAEAPVLDTSCACLLRLSEAVRDAGYKVVLTGEGADEALAGYLWFRTQRWGDRVARWCGRTVPRLIHRMILAAIGGGGAHRPAWRAMGPVRTVQQELSELFAQTRERLFTPSMWDRLDGHSPYAELELNPGIARWHPLNRSLYVGYKTMLPGLLLASKGDRVAMHNSVETRYPFLDEEVIAFCAAIDPEYKLKRMTEKWLLRQVAQRLLPRKIAARPKTMFRATMSRTFLAADRPAWVDQLLSPESLRRTEYFDVRAVEAVREWQTREPRWTTVRSFVFDMALTAVIATQLWLHTYCGGGLADLPTWDAPPMPHAVGRTKFHPS
ncbi:MAG: asparagine synthase (glutamine-hydrolyzing) [Phycisphaerae bacterium]